jgi:hypothetical protein
MTDKKLMFSSLILAASGAAAGAISVNGIVQLLGALTTTISALAVAYQTVMKAKADNAKSSAEAQAIHAQTQATITQTEAKKLKNKTKQILIDKLKSRDISNEDLFKILDDED